MDASNRKSANAFGNMTTADTGCPSNGLLIPYYAVHAARIGTWERHLITNEMTISAVLAGILGLPEKQTCLSLEQWEALIFPDDLPLLGDILEAAIQSGTPIDVEHRLLDVHGNVLWITSRGVVFPDETGKPIRVGGVAVDITEKKLIEESLRASEERYRHLAEMSPDGIIVNVNGRYVYANQAAARILGTDLPEKIIGRSMYDFTDADQRQFIAERAQKFLLRESETLAPIDLLFRQISGGSIDVQLTARWTRWAKQPAIQIMLRDVTELKQAQNRLRITSERLHFALESAGEGIWDWDIVNDKYEFSSGVRTLLAIPLHEPLPECVTESNFLHPEDTVRVHNALHTYLAGAAPSYECEFRIRAKDGQWKWVLSRGTIVSRDANGKPLVMTGTMSDITGRKESEATVWRHANLDALTGIPNRRLFRERFDMEIHRSQRHGQQLAILYIDLDRFKEVNDLYGHDAGDTLLVAAVQRMQRCVRQTDTIARLGGDEFAIIMPELNNSEHVDFVCQNLLGGLSNPFQVKKDHAYISASIGVALYPIDAADPEDLLRRADQAMFAAKRNGKNQFCYFKQSMDEKAHHKLRISNELRYALDNGQMSVHYQPIVDLSNGRIIKAEALLRWQHPTLGAVEPSAFIPYAEESGLISRLGDWVFAQAAQAAQRWSIHTREMFQVSVNKSPLQLMRRTADTDSLRHLDAMQVTGSHVAVEITEGILLHALPSVIERLQDYRNAGVQVAIDDFGTGYASMTYLQLFQIDYLKIDQSFIRDITSNPAHHTITETMILMAHKLGLKAIAEGVETQEQLDFLKAAGCDYAQGFLFSPALPPEQFEELLRSRMEQ
ncbi:EAL domain-containing protein [Noviherbaspirillum sp. 1P10PC]|uniref:bifunctional diguanylate cyclase/phosphodiesterase n=1 Tax=Noviherbaspirillum sp. 1P10PC TaxID=3132292 RepID=UPI0039A0315A